MSTASGQSQSKAGTSWRKRTFANYASLSYDDFLAEENKETAYRLGKLARPNAEKVIVLGKQMHTSINSIDPNLIGPSLKKRFVGGRQ